MKYHNDNKKEKKVIYCEICDMKFNTKKLLEHHTSTKKHKNKIINQEIKNDDKNDDKNKLSENEVKFWMETAKKEFFYTNKRDIVVTNN